MSNSKIKCQGFITNYEKTMKSCPVCKSKKILFFYEKKNFSYFTYPLKDRSKKNIKKKFSNNIYKNIRFKLCNKCGHIFLSTLPNEKILDTLYKKYYLYFSAQKQKKFSITLRENLFMGELEKLSLNNKNTLEIGCNDGYLLNLLKNKKYKVTGVEPGSSAITAKKSGIKVYKEYFSSNLFKIRKENFDIIICRHLLEHIKNCDNFILNLKKILSNDGVIALELPNVEYYVKKNSSETFFLQHYHYFSTHSVKRLFSQNGMKVVKIVNFSGDMIVFAKRKTTKVKNLAPSLWIKKAKKFYKNINDKNKNIKNFLLKNIKNNNKILCWGAGGYLYQLFHSFPFIKKFVSFIVDTDEKKWGLSFIDNNIKIVSPNRINLAKYKLIIISSSMFINSIIKELSIKKFKGRVASINPKTLIKNIS
jgi:2-polyprenyl-3-methyl-5-hydroxy-6-metoxy-1,4-benzoquinol methylase